MTLTQYASHTLCYCALMCWSLRVLLCVSLPREWQVGTALCDEGYGKERPKRKSSTEGARSNTLQHATIPRNALPHRSCSSVPPAATDQQATTGGSVVHPCLGHAV